jgi:hypothetical protein
MASRVERRTPSGATCSFSLRRRSLIRHYAIVNHMVECGMPAMTSRASCLISRTRSPLSFLYVQTHDITSAGHPLRLFRLNPSPIWRRPHRCARAPTAVPAPAPLTHRNSALRVWTPATISTREGYRCVNTSFRQQILIETSTGCTHGDRSETSRRFFCRTMQCSSDERLTVRWRVTVSSNA